MLDIANLSKRYGLQLALTITDLHVANGETLVLIGPSGCGKSTLLRLVVGLLPADSGSISLQGTPLSSDNILHLRQRMGYVIQEGGLFPHMTVFDNVTVMARYFGQSTDAIHNRISELAALVQLQDNLLQRYPSELSGGQRQRVSLMRALMLDPDLLLLDEPLGSLDPMIRYELQQELRAIFERLGKTVIMVTHDIAEAVYFGHRLVLMRAGSIIQVGSFRELVESPADPFVTQFINAQREPMQLLAQELR